MSFAARFSRTVPSIALAVFLGAIFFVLASCGETVESLSAATDEISMRVGDTVKAGDFVVKAGKGRVSYSVENSDAFRLKGDRLRALSEGRGTLVAYANGRVVRIPVVATDSRMVRISFPDIVATYDGEPHFPTFDGRIPPGATVRYVCGGADFVSAQSAGEYRLTARVTLPEGYALDCPSLDFALTVMKARYDLSGLGFGDRVLTYSGKPQTVEISGALPEGLTAQYVDNVAADVGEYVAKAVFSGEDENHEKIGEMTCRYSIVPAVVPIAPSDRIERAYDGEPALAPSFDGIPGLVGAEYLARSSVSAEPERVDRPSRVDAGATAFFARLFASESGRRNHAYTLPSRSAPIEFAPCGDLYASELIPFVVAVSKAPLDPGALALALDGVESRPSETREFEYGSPLRLGSGSEPGRRVAFLRPLAGAKGELARIAPEYRISASQRLEDSFGLPSDGILDSGLYWVIGSYPIPDRLAKNYVIPAPSILRLRVTRARCDVEGIEFDLPSAEREYDGTETRFALKMTDADALRLSVEYSGDRSATRAGRYAGRAALAPKENADNYEPIPDVTFTYVIRPKKLKISGVAFNDAAFVYDGSEKSCPPAEFEFDPPSGVVARYRALPDGEPTDSPPKRANAGKYAIEAIFKCAEGEPGDCVFFDGEDRASYCLIANLVISKAEPDFDASAYSRKSFDAEYFAGMRFSDIPLDSPPSGAVEWLDPDAEIGKMRETPDAPERGSVAARAKYVPPDPDNWQTVEFDAEATLKKGVVDLTGATIPDQFVPTGESLCVVLPSESDAASFAPVDFVAGVDGKVRASLKNPLNHRLVGPVEFDASIYRYDPGEYEYARGTTDLKKYVYAYGVSERLAVPSGTGSILADAFKSHGGSVASLALPSGVGLGSRSLVGLTGLRRLELDSPRIESASFVSLFGAAELKPAALDVLARDISEVPDRFFEGCAFARSITLEGSVESFGESCFAGCSALERFEFAESGLKFVGRNAFKGCVSLAELTLPSLVDASGSATSASYYFGHDMSSLALRKISLSSEVPYSLAPDAFKGLKCLEELNLSNRLVNVSERAFAGVALAAPLDLGSFSLELSAGCFREYAGDRLILPRTLSSIPERAFAESRIFSLDIPDSVATLSRGAFRDCVAEIRFGADSALESVPDGAFEEYACEGTLKLPSLVESIGAEAFKGCSLSSISLNPGLRRIGRDAFRDCANLDSISVPESVEELGREAFAGCSSLNFVKFRALKPPKLGRRVLPASSVPFQVYISFDADAGEYDRKLRESMSEPFAIAQIKF